LFKPNLNELFGSVNILAVPVCLLDAIVYTHIQIQSELEARFGALFVFPIIHTRQILSKHTHTRDFVGKGLCSSTERMLWYFASEHPTALISPRLPAQVGKCVASFVRAEENLVWVQNEITRYENSA
jgi:hypothetical protein